MEELSISEIAAISVAVKQHFGHGGDLKNYTELPEQYHSLKAEHLTYKLNCEEKPFKALNIGGVVYIATTKPRLIFS